MICVILIKDGVEKSTSAKDSDDDDEDDDLKPIDSMDVPKKKTKATIYFLRQFVETLPELESYDEFRELFARLPMLIERQLPLEHGEVSQSYLTRLLKNLRIFIFLFFVEGRPGSLKLFGPLGKQVWNLVRRRGVGAVAEKRPRKRFGLQVGRKRSAVVQDIPRRG